MSTVAEIEIPAGEFALHETLEAIPTAQFEIERVVAHEENRAMPFIWATAEGSNRETLQNALTADSSVESDVRLADYGDEWLYQMEWIANIQVVLDILLERQGTILNADGRNNKWYLRALFPDRDSLSATYGFCMEEDLSVTVGSIYELNGEHRDRYGLTEIQHETLITAVEQGYFDIPQESTLDDLAARLDITHQAASERLHRGHKALIKNALIVGQMGS